MTKKSTPPIDKLEHYDRLIATQPGAERKGKTMAYTSINGHMYSFIDNDGNMGLRLDNDERNQFLDQYNSELMVQYGRTMKEYVVVPAKLLEDTPTLAPYFAQSYKYVASLKPKPTKKK